MSLCHSCSSCTCNGWGRRTLVYLHVSGSEDGGCNYFKWWTEDIIEEIGNSENCEGRGEILVKTEESDGDKKTITNLEKSVAIFEK
ncbi:hypothetical protein DEO72_LG6g796 [Vigna unguiculata]|uniref:Uncharacterized protein n=1 Tax=Vigna unguiculata TaxID=3917 RepID=A0A4D6M8B9_VIGUN|nr:hypothetical protein DEO72_LG6g796 [Vigna unguiculata]